MSVTLSPVVSIVMPVYNAAEFLRVSVGSALAQSLQAIELICVDDGSTDVSRAVLAELALSDPRLRVIELTQNRGASAARNLGIDAAAGAYVSCLDADDEVPPDALERLLSAARRNECELAIGRLDWRRDPSAGAQPRASDAESSVTVARVRESTLLQSLLGSHCCNLYSRRLLDRHGIRYDTDLSLGEDQLFQATAIVLAERVAMIDDIVYVYHHYRGSSVTRRPPDLRNLVDDVEYQRRIARLFLAHGLPTAGIDYVRNWSYSIREYWLQIPRVLSRDEAGRFFAQFRDVVAEFGVLPWTAATPTHHQHLLGLIMEAQDDLALAFLDTDQARTGQTTSQALP